MNLELKVKIFAGSVIVDPPSVTMPEAQSGQLTWTPEPATLIIEYIGFKSPVGPGNSIQDLGPKGGTIGEGVPWTAKDNNSTKGLLSYNVFVRAGQQVFASDPQIVNEGPGGDVEPPSWESKP